MLASNEIHRVLVICAHPDDVDFGAAGTVATFTDVGIDVTYCLVTDGDAGGFDPAIPRTAIGRIRRDEQTRAAAAVGVCSLRFLGYPDGYLEPSLALRRDLAREIRRVRPQLVICQSAVRDHGRILASHPDHLAAGEASICAVYPDSRNEFWMPELLAEGFEPWTVPEVWIMGGAAPSHVVDITSSIDRKLEALAAHASQHRDPAGLLDAVRTWMRSNAVEHGLGEDRYAELFTVVATG